MAISGVSTSGILSGIDMNGLIDQIISIEERPITLLAMRQNDYELKIASVLNLSAKLASYKSSIESLNDIEKFNTKNASVSKTSGGTELLTVSADATSADGSYSVKVNQLASASKIASDGWNDTNSTAIASAAGSFKFKVGSSGAVTSVGVTSSTTLQGLKDSINNADAGVTASIINDGTGSNGYRLILTSDDTGSANEITITQNDTLLDFANKKVEAAYADTTNTYSGTVASNSGNNYTGTTNKTFLLEAVSTGESGTATYKYSVDGGINWLGYGGAAYDSGAADDTSGGAITTSTSLKAIDGSAAANEGVEASFTAGSSMAVGDRFTVDVFNPEMQTAKDAVIEVDNAIITKSSNTITDAIQGVTMDLLQADTSSTLTLTVSSSSELAKEDIGSFVDSYNDLFKFIEEQASFDPEEDDEPNPLLGDPTLNEIKRRITGAVSGTIPGLSNATYEALAQIGINSDYKTGQLSIDSTQLEIALSSDPDAVSKLFVGSATPTDQAIEFESKTSKTQAGTYGISISTAAEQATLTGDNDLSSTGLGSDEVLIFKYSTNYTDTDSTSTAFSATLTAGSTINTIVTTLNSAFATNNAGLTASNSEGKLKITTTEYGADQWFKITTDQGNAANQIWDTADSREDAGVDIAGSINGHVAVGKGKTLTAVAGFPEEGLSISTTTNQTGLFGTISVSRGIADLLPSLIDSYSNSETGILRLKESAMKDSIDDIGSRILRMQSKLADKEERLVAQFARLEVLLSKYDSISQFLTNTVTALQNAKYFD
jgi:flagellar hook-associated protein 2